MRKLCFMMFLVSSIAMSKPVRLSDREASKALEAIYLECLGRKPGVESLGDLKQVKHGRSRQVRGRLCRSHKTIKLGKGKLLSK